MIVLKWPLAVVGGTQSVELPVGAEVVHVDIDGNRDLCLWTVSVNKVPKVSRDFVVVGTGHQWDAGLSYIGTAKFVDPIALAGVSLGERVLMWHVLERLAP